MVGSGYGLGYLGEYGMEMRHCVEFVYYNESMTLHNRLHSTPVSNIPKGKPQQRFIFTSLDR